jgi:hypothetical protein
MIDRTTFDLRVAEHTTTTAGINRTDWQRQGEIRPSAIRSGVAAALVALAARLDPALQAHTPRPGAITTA